MMKKRVTKEAFGVVSPLFGRAARCVSLAAVVVGLCFPSAPSGAARASSPLLTAWQQPQRPPKPKIADEEAQPPKEIKEPRGGKKGNSGKPNGGAAAGGRRVQTRIPQYDVFFVTTVPQAELFRRNDAGQYDPLGKTNDEGKLSVKLARGKHFIIASRQGHQIVRQQIEVRPDNNTFNFDLAIARPKETKTDSSATLTPTPEEAAEAARDQAAENASRVEQIFARMLDPKETAGVPQSDWEFVLAQMGKSLLSDPANSPLQARALFAQGQIAFLGKDYPNALILFNKAALAEPKMVAALYGLGNAYTETNQPGEAFKAYERASKADANFALAYKGMGDALVKQNKVKESKKYYERFQSMTAQPATHAGLAPAVDLMKRKRWAEALSALEELAKTEPSSDLYLYIGECYERLEKRFSASQSYLRAIELDPKSAQAHYKYGNVMYEMREYARAFEHLELALALNQTGVGFKRERAREMANEAAKKIKKK